MGVCAWAWVSAAPRHSWLGCWGVCVLGARSACAPPLLAGVCGVGVCVWARVVAAPRLSWLGCWGVRVCVRASLLPRHSRLGCAVWVCVLGLGFRLRPATPRWGVGARVCLCACSACTPPLLAGVCGVGACAWARFSAAPRHSWLGCWGVCVLVWALRLCPATPGWGVRCGCACLGSGFGCAPPLLAGVLGCVCVFVCLLRLYPATPGWGARCGWVCLGSGFRCAPPLLAWVLGCVCVFVCLLRLYPATPGWGVRCGCVCLGSGFRLRPATAGWGVGVCACLCALSACTPPLLAGVCGVGVCAWARGFGCAPPLLAGVSGCVCACVRAHLVPRHSWLGFVVCGFGVAWHPSLCRGSLRVVRAARVCGTLWRLLLVTCPCALVVAGGVPLWRAWWPRFGAPLLVRSGRPRCSGRLSRRRGAVPHPGGLCPRLYWVAARGTRRPAENRALCACRWPPPWLGRWAPSASYPFGAPRWGCPWRVPPASVLGCVRCGGWRVWTQSLTRPVSRTVRLSTGDSAGAPGLFPVDANTAPFRVGGRHARVPCVCACACACPSWPRRAGWPPGRVVVRLTFSCGRSWCALCLLGPLRAGVALCFFLCAPVVSGVPCFRARAARSWCLAPPPFFFCPPFFFFSLCAPVVSGVPCFPARGALGLGVFLSPPPPPLFFLLFLALFVPPPLAFFFSLCALVVSCVPCFPARGALGLGVFLSPPLPPFSFFFLLFLRPFCFFFPAPGFFFCAPVVSGVPCVPAWGALGLVVAPTPPLLFFPSCLFFAFCFFLFFLVCALPVVRCGAGVCVLGCGVCWCVLRWCCPCRCSLCGALSPLWCWLLLCGAARGVWVFAVGPGCPPLPSGGSWCRVSVVLSLSGRVARRPVVWCGVPWCSAALCCVLWRCAVVWWCAVVLCCFFASWHVPVVCFLPLGFCCVCSGVPCCAFPVLCALCGAVLRCVGALVLCCPRGLRCFWCLVLLVPGVAACFWGSAGGSGCLVLSFGDVCRPWCPCLAVSPVARRLPCGVLFPCVVSCGAVLPCGVVLWCPVVFFSFFFCLACGAGCLFPPKKFPVKPVKMVFHLLLLLMDP